MSQKRKGHKWPWMSKNQAMGEWNKILVVKNVFFGCLGRLHVSSSSVWDQEYPLTKMFYGASRPHNILTIGTLIHSHLGHCTVDTQTRGPCAHVLYIDTTDWIHQVHNQMRVLIPESCAFSCEQNVKTAYFIWKICTFRFWWIQWIVS